MNLSPPLGYAVLSLADTFRTNPPALTEQGPITPRPEIPGKKAGGSPVHGR